MWPSFKAATRRHRLWQNLHWPEFSADGRGMVGKNTVLPDTESWQQSQANVRPLTRGSVVMTRQQELEISFSKKKQLPPKSAVLKKMNKHKTEHTEHCLCLEPSLWNMSIRGRGFSHHYCKGAEKNKLIEKKSLPNIPPSPQLFIETCKGSRCTNVERGSKTFSHWTKPNSESWVSSRN